MKSFVLGASMALARHFRDAFVDRARRVSEVADASAVVVPQHWFAEVADGMLIGERRKRSSIADGSFFASRIVLLNLDVDIADPARTFDVILPLARARGLTVYDTLHFEIAERRGLPLASLDDQLNAAARRVGIALVEETA